MTDSAEDRFRRIFRRAHAGHVRCRADEWLMRPCATRDGLAERPVVWSRRNGPWRRVDVLWVGAAPGNAGGRGRGAMGAHGTRIPFGGDIAGGNLDVLLESIGLDRNHTFIVAALNQLPDRGGGEPSRAELLRPAGDYPSSLHLLRDTLIAAGARLVVALGNVALRSTVAAARLEDGTALPTLRALEGAGLGRGLAARWPRGFEPDAGFLAAWRGAWHDDPPPTLLWLLHPSGQNMSPYAGPDTAFHRRMVETQVALRQAGRDVLGGRSPTRGASDAGIYALPEWTQAIGPRHAELVRLWHAKGL